MEHADISPPETRSAPIHRSPLSDSLEPVSALNESPAAFDPVRWLADFEAVGGGWALHDHRFTLMTQIEGRSRSESVIADQMIFTLTDKDRAELIAHLRQREGRA